MKNFTIDGTDKEKNYKFLIIETLYLFHLYLN